MALLPFVTRPAIIAALGWCVVSASAAAADRPNVVFLLADDLGAADLGCYGSTFYETPAIDRLAADGAKFTSFYAAGSVCSPSRASIMTGKYPPRTGITDWIPGQDADGRRLQPRSTRRELALEEVTLAEAFREAGYQTFYAGKWHLGRRGYLPTDQGFDQHLEDNKPDEEDDRGRAGKRQRRLGSTERLTDGALDFLEQRDKDKPFLLFLSYHDVHAPIQPIPGLVRPFEAKAADLDGETPSRAEHDGWTRLRQDDPAYASMVSALDRSVGRLRDRLEELGLAENTIIVFTSDNGGLSTGRNMGPTSNEPWRAGKGWLYEGGIRVPLLICAPGLIPPGAVDDTPLISCDFYPTLLELSSLPLRPEQHLDGASFASLVREEDKDESLPLRRALFWHYPHYQGSTWTPGAAIREGDWKLVEFYDYDKAELYDLKSDPGEKHDLAAEKTDLVRDLRDKLKSWQESVGAEIPLPEREAPR